MEPLAPATNLSGVEQTDLVTLVRNQESVGADCRLLEVYQRFQAHELDYCAVLADGRVLGLCSRARVGFLMGHRYGVALYGNHAIRQHLVEHPLFVQRGTPIREVLEQALGRPVKEFNDDIVLVGPAQEFLGIIPVLALVQLQSALVEEKFQLQEAMHHQMLTLSRQAGMAEVATGVLHNVGNVLNSVNVSNNLMREKLRGSEMATLVKLGSLLQQHEADLPAFLTADVKGKLIPRFIIQLASQLQAEHAFLENEQDQLTTNLDHIKEIVALQQNYARVSGYLEQVSIPSLVDDALQLNVAGLSRHEVKVVRQYADVPPATVDKHKVLQILVNLVHNAKYALDDAVHQDKRLTVGVELDAGQRVKITVSDNGIGIPPEHLTKIFSHGFTTRKGGHGFGLHSGANSAKEMGGQLSVHSEGLGKGATFTLELPLVSAKTRNDGLKDEPHGHI
ncbi:MAG: ATP-binding protein [Verrucomicrobiota bacterium]